MKKPGNIMEFCHSGKMGTLLRVTLNVPMIGNVRRVFGVVHLSLVIMLLVALFQIQFSGASDVLI